MVSPGRTGHERVEKPLGRPDSGAAPKSFGSQSRGKAVAYGIEKVVMAWTGHGAKENSIPAPKDSPPEKLESLLQSSLLDSDVVVRPTPPPTRWGVLVCGCRGAPDLLHTAPDFRLHTSRKVFYLKDRFSVAHHHRFFLRLVGAFWFFLHAHLGGELFFVVPLHAQSIFILYSALLHTIKPSFSYRILLFFGRLGLH